MNSYVFQRSIPSEEGYDIVVAEGFIYTVQPAQAWLAAFRRLLRTDGYILTAPSERGTVDIPSNVHAQNGAVEIDRGQ